MLCKICTQLEEAVAASKKPDAPSILQGLTAVGLRNRARQKEERSVKAQEILEKHRRSCQIWAGTPPS